MTTQQTHTLQPRCIHNQPHQLGMGWHHIWEYDPPIENHVKRSDGTSCSWRESGESSEGCIMWLADRFARRHLGTTAREIFGHAYKARKDCEFHDEWLNTDVLRGKWAEHTILPKRWSPANVRKLFEDLEDVNYHSFLTKLIELIETHLPTLAARLSDWCKPVPKTTHTSTPTQ